jgi:hypothetical protein
MTRHGPTQPQAAAIALRSTARDVLDAGNTDPVADFRTVSRGGSYHIRIDIIEPALEKPRHTAAASILSGDFTSKSP